MEQYGWALASAAHMCTVYATVLVAVHRFVYVCRPHDTERLSGLRRAKLHVAAVPLFAFLYNLPRVFEYNLISTVDDNNAAGSSSSNGDDSSSDGRSLVWNATVAVVDDFGGSGKSLRKKLEFSAIGGSIWFQIVYKNTSEKEQDNG